MESKSAIKKRVEFTLPSQEKKKLIMTKRRSLDDQEIDDDDITNGKNMKKLVIHESGSQQKWLPGELVFELLMRLPLKNIHQCKCVSKYWLSIIHSPSFSEAYFSRHCGGLLISVAEETTAPDLRVQVQLGFYYSSLLQVDQPPEPFFCRFKLPPSHSYKGVTQVVNGLACVYQDESVFVCNVCTREVVRLPDPLLLIHRSCYHLGYDPINKVYKLLRLNQILTDRAAAVAAKYRQAAALFEDRWRVVEAIDANYDPEIADYDYKYKYLRSRDAALADFQRATKDAVRYWRAALRERVVPYKCEILTLGCSFWSSQLIGNQNIIFDSKSLSINGVLYWINLLLIRDIGLVSFNLNTNEFKAVKPPQEDLSLLRNSPNLKLVEFKGRLALSSILCNPDECRFVLHTLEDNGGDSWCKHVIRFPPGFGDLASIGTLPVGNLPTGQLLLNNPRVKVLDQDSRGYFTPVYAYDEEKDEFDWFAVGKLPKSLDYYTEFPGSISYLVENNTPLRHLFDEGGDISS